MNPSEPHDSPDSPLVHSETGPQVHVWEDAAAEKSAADREKISGSLYGLLVGDALGCPAEGMSEADIKARFGILNTMLDTEPHYRPAGLHSDDGQQALALLDAVVSDPEAPSNAFAAGLIALLEAGEKGYRRFGLHRGTGANFRRTVMALKRGEHKLDAANVTAGNGAAMRIAPVALFHRDDPSKMVRALTDASVLTHLDARGVAAAGAVAELVRQAFFAEDKKPTELDLDLLVTRVREVEAEFARHLNAPLDERYSTLLSTILNDAFEGDIDERLTQIEALVASEADRPVSALSGFAPASVTSSLLFYLRATDFQSALITTVNKGGDADTTAAMVGQMAGAHWGRKSIPQHWLDDLCARGMIEDRIDAILNKGRDIPFGFSLVELETPWTKRTLDEADRRRRIPSDQIDAPRDRHESTPAPSATLASENSKEDSQDQQKTKPFRAPPRAKTKRAKKDAARPQLGLFDLGPAQDDESVTESPQEIAAGEPVSETTIIETTVDEPTSVEAAPPTRVEQSLPPQTPVVPSTTQASILEKKNASPHLKNITSDLSPRKLSEHAFANDPLPIDPRIVFQQGDITQATVEVIVNAANSSLRGGGGVDGAIHRAAGKSVMVECEAIRSRQGGCRTGDAVMTGAGALAAQHIIHAVGPRWRGGTQNEDELLARAYKASLEIANAAALRTIAFPSISTGSYRFPLERAAQIAVHTADTYLSQHPKAFDQVVFILFSAGDLAVYQNVAGRPRA